MITNKLLMFYKIHTALSQFEEEIVTRQCEFCKTVKLVCNHWVTDLDFDTIGPNRNKVADWWVRHVYRVATIQYLGRTCWFCWLRRRDLVSKESLGWLAGRLHYDMHNIHAFDLWHTKENDAFRIPYVW